MSLIKSAIESKLLERENMSDQLNQMIKDLNNGEKFTTEQKLRDLMVIVLELVECEMRELAIQAI